MIGSGQAAVGKRQGERGSALLMVMLLVAIMAVISLAIVNRTTNEMDASSAKRRYDQAVSCADGARAMLLSQFRAFGVNPTQLTLDTQVNDKRYSSGHYDTFATASVTAATGSQASNVGVSDIANRLVKNKLGGAVYRINVVCSDTSTSSRQSEVEFLVRFGL